MMSRQQRLIQLPLLGTILLCSLAVYLVACRRFSKPRPSDTITKHSVDTNPDDALKYWTADRMRNAKPAPMPNVADLHQEKLPPHKSRPQHS